VHPAPTAGLRGKNSETNLCVWPLFVVRISMITLLPVRSSGAYVPFNNIQGPIEAKKVANSTLFSIVRPASSPKSLPATLAKSKASGRLDVRRVLTGKSSLRYDLAVD